MHCMNIKIITDVPLFGSNIMRRVRCITKHLHRIMPHNPVALTPVSEMLNLAPGIVYE